MKIDSIVADYMGECNSEPQVSVYSAAKDANNYARYAVAWLGKVDGGSVNEKAVVKLGLRLEQFVDEALEQWDEDDIEATGVDLSEIESRFDRRVQVEVPIVQYFLQSLVAGVYLNAEQYRVVYEDDGLSARPGEEAITSDISFRAQTSKEYFDEHGHEGHEWDRSGCEGHCPTEFFPAEIAAIHNFTGIWLYDYA